LFSSDEESESLSDDDDEELSDDDDEEELSDDDDESSSESLESFSFSNAAIESSESLERSMDSWRANRTAVVNYSVLRLGFKISISDLRIKSLIGSESKLLLSLAEFNIVNTYLWMF